MGGSKLKNIIGVRFRQQSRIYFFDPGDNDIKVGDHVIVETSQGQDYAEVVIAKREIKDENLKKHLKKEQNHGEQDRLFW